MNDERVAIIPARSGSKRIPGKNIRPFAGKPMIAHAIAKAVESGMFSRIIVSTDSEEIAATARSYGADVPFMRPASLACDHTPTAPVLLHALEWLEEHAALPRYGCCIYPAVPLLDPEFLHKGFALLRESGAPVVISLAGFASPVQRALRMDGNGAVSMFHPEHEMSRSNDLESAYYDAGQFYWFDCRRFIAAPRLYCTGARGVVIPRHLAVDIDTPEDWQVAEVVYNGLFRQAESEEVA